MPAPELRQQIIEVPLKMVGGNLFGRYPKVSVEQTWNMIVSDNALVPYAGYKNVLNQSSDAEGRGLYSSSRGGFMFAVWGTASYTITGTTPDNLAATFRGSLTTSTGDVFIAENNNGEIAFTDGVHIYVYNYLTDTFKTSQIIPVTDPNTQFLIPTALTNPGYISFQNGRLIVANTSSTNWYLSGANAATTWTGAANAVGALQSKPDKVQAAVPAPGAGNNLYVFGHNVIEQWQDVGAALFPYQRASTFNVDFGTINASSIAALDNYVVWLAANEQSGVTLMAISGNVVKPISTDGINFKLTNLTNPENCNAFLFRQDGHVIYQFTFIEDNLSYAYDFNTGLFFTVSDEKLDYHVARDVVFYRNEYYFVSLKGGNLYHFSTNITDIDYGLDAIWEIPRIRVSPPVRLPSQRMFIIKSLGFTIENGRINDEEIIGNEDVIGLTLATENLVDITTEDGVLIGTESTSGGSHSLILYSEVVDLSISRDGGESFGNSIRLNMNPTGRRRSRFIWQRLGQANDTSYQIRFSGFGRFVAFDGIVEIYS